LPRLDFRFITISIKKNRKKNYASYPEIARLLVRELESRFTEIKIEMDSNPVLHSEIKKVLCYKKLKYIRVKQAKAHSNNLIQLADYVVSLSAKKVKDVPKATEWYRPIVKKQLVLLDVRE
jgi:hypothetical protein